MKIIIRTLFIFLILQLFVEANKVDDRINGRHYSGMWGKFTKLEVTYSSSKKDKGTTFTYYFNDKESLMTFETKNGIAKIYSIPRFATLWSGIDKTGIHSSCREYVKDTKTIIQGYALRPLFFLGFGAGSGPEKINTKIDINKIITKNVKIQINPGDSIRMKPNWTLQGYIKKENKNKFSFELLQKYKNTKSNLYLTGTWQNNPITLPIDNKDLLKNYLVCIPKEYTKDKSNIKTIQDLKSLTKP